MKKMYKIILLLFCISIISLHLSSSLSIEDPDVPTPIIPPIKEEVPVIEKPSYTKKIEEEIKNYIQTDINNIGLYYLDLNTEEKISINEDIPFESASIAKLFVVMYGYEQIYLDNIKGDSFILYNSETDYEDGTGILQYKDLSQPQTVEYLLEVAITHSDNIAFNMLLRYLDATKVFEYYEKIIKHQTPHDDIWMSANDTQKLLNHIYTNPVFNKMKEDMKHSQFNDRIAYYLPKGIVAHKIGNYDTVVHDAAIIEIDQPYILVIFTDDLENAYEKIAQISKIIYDIKIT